jgi:hypothetical protein
MLLESYIPLQKERGFLQSKVLGNQESKGVRQMILPVHKIAG